jgi:ubiquitin C-terminal hydrolase
MSFVINALAESIPAADAVVSLKTELKSACIGCDFSGKSFQSTNIPIFLQLPETPDEVALPSLIQDYFASTLPEDFRCEGCGVRGSIKINPIITAVPDLLVLTLSRYAYGAEKKTTSVAIPDGLNLKVFADTILGADQLEYKLIGVVRHAGGHYTCDYFENFQWYHADDAMVVPIEAPLKTGADPFLLVYERSVEE